MSIPPRQPVEQFRIPKGASFVRVKGTTKFKSLGNTPTVTYTNTDTTQDYPNFTDSLGLPAYSATTAREATLAITTQSMSPFVLGLADVATPIKLEQPAQEDQTFAVPGPIEVGDVIALDKFMVTVDSFKSGVVNFNLTDHYLVDGQAGLVIVTALPDTYDGMADGTITFDADAYTANQKQGLSSGSDVYVEFLFRYTNANGVKEYMHFYNAKITNSDARNLVSDTDLDTRAFSLKLEADPTKPSPGFYTVTELPPVLAV